MKLVIGGLLLLFFQVAAAAGRDTISIVGSSTVFPFSKVVAERFGRGTAFRSPTVEATGSGGGFKEFCQGLGTAHPDIVNASRRIKRSELANCRANGVNEVIEVLIGYDGIVLANSVRSPRFLLSERDIFLALAARVPDASGKLIPNPHSTWKQINPRLPDTEIRVFGPPSTSGTRDAFLELTMEPGCLTFEHIEALRDSDWSRFRKVCHRLRRDGGFIEAGENDNLIVQKLNADPDALGVFGYSFLDQNSDKVQASHVNGYAPDFDTIADGSYPVSRPLYLYIKKAHISVIPGIAEYLREFTSERAWGEEGYLADKGMIPLATELRRRMAQRVANGEALDPADLK